MESRFTYPQLSGHARAKLMKRAEAMLVAQQQLIEQGGAHAFMLRLSGHEDEAAQREYISDWHYPKGDRIDYASGSQYFYHCHREDKETQEHGHFHCYIRRSGWPKSWSLKRIPQRALYLNSPMTHIVAIGIDRYGMPIRLFMVNRWVSKESWFGADKMQRLAKRFDLSQVKNERPKTGNQAPEWQMMDVWVESIVQLFLPQIQWLYEQRDAKMKALMAKAAKGENPYLDKQIEELASIDISLESQIGWLTGERLASAA
jgi:hypothetical protein